MSIFCNSTPVPFSELFWYIAPHVVRDNEGDLPDPVIEKHLKSAATKFIKDSEIIRRWLSIDGQDCVADYPIELEDCYAPLSVKKLYVNGCEYHPAHEEDKPPGYKIAMNTYWLEERNWIYMNPAPGEDSVGSIQLYLSVYPTNDTCSLPEDIYHEWGEDIANGALAELLSIRSEPWYDPTQSRLRERKFKAAITSAKNSAIKGNVAGKHRPIKSIFRTRSFR